LQELYDERRKHKRADLRVKAEYEIVSFVPQALRAKSSREKISAQTANISEGGVQLVVDRAPEPGNVVRLSIYTGPNDAGIKAFAKVKWAGFDSVFGKFRLGMEFYFLNAESRERIRSLVN
jgi:c-di-GMP-binding flagellar brake protein YcgR